MLTPQEVKGKEFETSFIGGYDKASVDDFFRVVAEDYSSLYKENATLKNKMKALADKVEEYRSTEEAMHQALFAAQKVAQELTEDAKQKHDALIDEAERVAREHIEALKVDIRDQEYRLDTAKRETAEFTSAAQLLLEKFHTFLGDLNSLAFKQERVQELQQQELAESINISLQKQIEEQEKREAAKEAQLAAQDSVVLAEPDVKTYISSQTD
ncbi:MAG: DivIVA domain-containing protein [Oscillospiraceae bacterium]|nr:DivIVA domain-containing protein [Oscillospiraceae bacterium]